LIVVRTHPSVLYFRAPKLLSELVLLCNVFIKSIECRYPAPILSSMATIRSVSSSRFEDGSFGGGCGS